MSYLRSAVLGWPEWADVATALSTVLFLLALGLIFAIIAAAIDWRKGGAVREGDE